VVDEPNPSMKTPLIAHSSLRSHASHACVVALLTTLAGCTSAPITRYSRADLDIVLASDVPAGITAPVPIRTVAPEYPNELRRLGIEGSADVVFLVDEKGTVRDAGYVTATRRDFAESAIAAVKQWSFAPGTRNGTPVAMRTLIPFQFAFETGERGSAAAMRVSLR
jgi:TonB family protein